jgi:hypothetical protein
MSPVRNLVARIAKSGYKSHGSYGSSGYHYNNNSVDYEDDDDDDSGLPRWAIFLIVYFSILLLVFISSLIYYWKRGKSFRLSIQFQFNGALKPTAAPRDKLGLIT